MQDFFNGLYESFVKTFITDDRWVQLLNGLLVTVEITLFAAAIGVAIGFLIAIVCGTQIDAQTLTFPFRACTIFLG